MYNSYYRLTFNPFDKQQLKGKKHFISRDFTEMTKLLNYLKDIRGIGVFTVSRAWEIRMLSDVLLPRTVLPREIPD